MGIKKAKTKELRKISAGELGQAGSPAAASEKTTPAKQKSTQLVPRLRQGSAEDAVEKLKFEVRVI